jgi:metallo-beta-lactamase class B
MTRLVALTIVGLTATSALEAQVPNWSQRAGWNSKTDVKIQIPFKVFDNIYYVGTDHVSSYLITTTDGLVLIDATNAKAADGVLENVRKLGFDPSRIKYVFITQAHQDHYGGAPRIKAATGATIGMSREDLEFLDQKKLRPNHWEYQWSLDPAPARDLLLSDNRVMEVGDAVFKFHFTPGHTPGTTSMEFIARHGDRQYRVLTPGGLGFSYAPEWNDAHIKSMELLKQRGPWDVVLSNHPFMMPVHLFEKMQHYKVDGSKPGPHPLVLGQAAISDWLDRMANIAREKAEYDRTGRAR